jgi:hypothetical protein
MMPPISRMDGFITTAARLSPKWCRPIATLLILKDETENSRGRTMYKRMPLLILASSLAVISPTGADAAKDPYPHMAPLERYLPVSRAAEIALARSAAPAAVSDKAEILVLGVHGFESTVPGSNGFVCYVGRSWEKGFNDPEFWNPNVRTPQCWNAAAVRSVLPEYLKRTQWVLARLSKEEMAARTKAAWADHEFGAPAPQSMAFMMSKDQYISDPTPGAEAHWYPHVMFFVPTTEDSKWGANVGGPIFATTSDAEPITTFFVVAPNWSDGALGPYAQTVPTATTAEAETHHHR